MRLFSKMALLLASSMLILLPLRTYAAVPKMSVDLYFEKQEYVLSIMEEIKIIHREQLKELTDRLNKQIIENGYDYDLTYESLNEKGDPAVKVDYTGMLAAYMTCKEYLAKNGQKRELAFADINPFELSVRKSSIHEVIPVRVQEYNQQDDGNYKKAGYHYTQEPETVPEYKILQDGTYAATGHTIQITPHEETTLYGDSEITVKEPEFIFSLMHVPYDKETQNTYEFIKEYLSYLVSNEGIISTYGASLTYEEAKSAEMDAYIRDAKARINEALQKQQESTETDEDTHITLNWTSINTARANIVEAATSLVGRIPYLWGGKARKPGYDETWWTYRADGKQNGLDCSGFVQWAYMTAGFPQEIYRNLISTKQILATCETIDRQDLQPGDIGLLNNGEGVNHCGIYLGDNKFVHCSSSKKTVTISEFPFKVFKRVPNSEVSNINIVDLNAELVYSSINIDLSISVVQNNILSSNELLLVAQLMTSEAVGEGLNGLAAVAEVVKNRLDSPLFPDSVYDVIYQENESGIKQFSDNSRIRTMVPSQSTLEIAGMVFSGQLKVLDNPDVLFYRRPAEGCEYDDWGTYPFYTRINHHSFYTTD